MGTTISSLFPPLAQFPDIHQLPPHCIASDDHPFPTSANFFGVMQLIVLGLGYSMIVLHASNLIADGSELLLLIPSIAPTVGSLVLPVLGAIPDGCMVLFSGLGPRATVQNDLAVGVGALAGSTIMLLTVPWFLAVLSGRVDIDVIPSSNGVQFADYLRRPKLSDEATMHTSGVEPHRGAMKVGAYAMLLTTIPYLIIQGSAFAYSKDSDEKLASDEQSYALAGLILCVISFVLYLRQHLKGASHDEVLINVQDLARMEAVRSGIISLQAAFQHALKSEGFYEHLGVPLLELEAKDEAKRLKIILHHFFAKYDTDESMSIDARELNLLLADLRCPHTPEDVDACLKAMDADGSGDISFDEFVAGMTTMISAPPPPPPVKPSPRLGRASLSQQQQQQSTNGSTTTTNYGTLNATTDLSRPPSVPLSTTAGLEEDQEEEEEMPDDLVHLPVKEQRKRIVIRSLRTMGLGVLLVLLFSDPLVDVMSEMGEVLGVSGFYISFVFAPLASNASEIIASYGYAKKKTAKTITISLSTLMGAATLNNTFVLGIFLSLVKFRELEWKFSAETLVILIVELIMGSLALRKVQTMRMAYLVLALCPLALIGVWFLENVVGLD